MERLGAKAIVFTVDVAWDSKRTLDVRTKTAMPGSPSERSQRKNAGVAQAIGGYQDRDLTWKDISFIRASLPSFRARQCSDLFFLQQHTKLPIIVKGVQCVEDIQLCVDHGVEGIVLVRCSMNFRRKSTKLIALPVQPWR